MKPVEARRLWILIFAVAVVVPAGRGVWINMPSSGQKCISEELHNNVLVMSHYFSFYGEEDGYNNNTVLPTMTVKVSSPFGNELYLKENVSHGHFAFTTTEPGNYVVCFSLDSSNQNGKRVTVGLEWKIGIFAKDWDSIAKKEKIEGLELGLRKLEDSVQAIRENMNHLMRRELKMRRVSKTTNTRVARYSIVSLGVCIVVSLLQLWYLRRYFRNKKLI